MFVAYSVLLMFIELLKWIPPFGIPIDIESGQIEGKVLKSLNGNLFYAFQQVPYAAPPIGNLRFQPPQPVQPWSGTLETKENTKICYQVLFDSDMEDEDCLYLNVYSPKIPLFSNPNLPVMVWYHGGGFIEGDGTYSMYGPDFFMDYGVIIVTLNYRLGPFGFSSTQDEVLPGNYGLKDQLFALQWVNRNIKYFGGDPEKVTIFGQSAGAASVSYLLLNQNSANLYRGAILESGSSINSWAYQRNARHYTYETAIAIDSNLNHSVDTTELVNFLKGASAKDLDLASRNIMRQQTPTNMQIMHGFFYAPVIEVEHETSYLTKEMFETVASGRGNNVPIIIGMNSEESISQATDLNVLFFMMLLYDANLEWLVPPNMNVENLHYTVGKKIRQIYVEEGNALAHDAASSIKFLSDFSFCRAVAKYAELQSDYSKVYFYQFSHDGVIGNVSVEIPGAGKVGHNEELPYIWKIRNGIFDNYNFTQFPREDIEVHRMLLTLWTNFAKTLNPTPEKDEFLQRIEWPFLSVQNRQKFPFLNIDNRLEILNRPRNESARRWDALYKSYGKRPFINF